MIIGKLVEVRGDTTIVLSHDEGDDTEHPIRGPIVVQIDGKKANEEGEAYTLADLQVGEDVTYYDDLQSVVVTRESHE